MPVIEALAQKRNANAEALDLEQLGVFGPNKSAPVHRWVSFTEGFSAQLVARELASYDASAFIFDPFGGTGTTPLVAVQLGHAAAWSEVNPYLREAATTKIASARAARPVRTATATTLRGALLLGPGDDDPVHPLTRADAEREFFPPGSAAALVQWLTRFESLDDELAQSIGRLAVASVAIAVSNMKRAVDLRRRTPAELRRATPDVDEAVRQRVLDMIEDLERTPSARGVASLVSSDARALPEDLPPIDLVVTSPPYLNGTNYCRNTKLELLLLRHMDTEMELADLRAASVTAGINNVSRRMRPPLDLPEVRAVAEALDERGYDRRIATMVRGYFSDMKIVLAELRNRMASQGRLVLDIGDSRFAGVHVDTPTLLISVAETVGWQFDRDLVIRSRVAKDGSPLCQKLLYLSST